GFERFYGFLGGDTHQYYPDLVYDNHHVEPEKTPEEGYHLTVDLVDKAKAFIADAKQVAPDKPFFLYFCPGAMHAPHHVPKEWENTLVMFISDNGASAEGGPTGSVNENLFFNCVPESLEENLKAIDELGGPKHFNHYPWGWTFAGNTPFRRWKRETYRGGISDPFIVHWPKGIQARGEVRTQYAHAIDMVPTVLEALDIEAPNSIKGVTQSPIEGHSFAHVLNDAGAPTRHITQYFEMMGHRSIYHDGWRAVCPWPGPSFKESGL